MPHGAVCGSGQVNRTARPKFLELFKDFSSMNLRTGEE